MLSETSTCAGSASAACLPSEDCGASTVEPDIPQLSIQEDKAIDTRCGEAAQTEVQEEEETPEDDVEASFIRCDKPPCTRTNLVSCLSSRSTSPGPLSPLLSDDDLPSSELSSTNSSRRTSESHPSSRVRFKRGCVITAVNLTWAATSYDRAPINVAQSLDMKRCHSIDCSGEDADADTDKWISYGDASFAAPPSPPLPSSPCTAAHTAFAYASTDSELTGDGLSLEHSPVPTLCHEDSSSGSDSDECHWLNKCTLQTYGAEDRQLSPIECDSDQVSSRLQLDTINLSLNSYEQEEGSMTPKPRKDSIDQEGSTGCTGRKSKYNLSKFSRNDEMFECEALGGF